MSAGENPEQRLRRFIGLSVSTLLGALSLTSCGDYDPETSSSAGGTMTTSGMLQTAGQTAMAGSGGSAAQTALGGASGSVSMGAGGSSGGTGGSASSTGGSGATVASVEADCDDVSPCGGDVVGTWIVAGSCLPVSGQADMSGFGLGCTSAPLTGMLEVTGAWTAGADGTFMDETTTSGSSEIELPPECLTISGTTTTCDRVDGALEALGYASVACANSASGGCTCSATVQQTGGMAAVSLDAARTGTYTTANDIITASSRSDTQYSYCVSGTTLTLTPQSSGRTGTLAGTIVLQKQ